MKSPMIRNAVRVFPAIVLFGALLAAGNAISATKKTTTPAPAPAPAPSKPSGTNANSGKTGTNPAAKVPNGNAIGGGKEGAGNSGNSGNASSKPSHCANCPHPPPEKQPVVRPPHVDPPNPSAKIGSDKQSAPHPLAPKANVVQEGRNGRILSKRPDDKVADVHDPKRGMDIHHGLNGAHKVSVEYSDHSRVVFQKGRPGYVQHPYPFHNHEFARRTFVYHGHVYDRYYRGYTFRGAYLNVYAPAYYYGPGFYSWAYYPWDTSVAYGWGFAGSPWYGYFGGFFASDAAYTSPASWLTDYLISTDLQSAFAAHKDAGESDGDPATGGQPALSSDIKSLIAVEVRNQLSMETYEQGKNAQQQDVEPNYSGIEPLITDGKPHVFVAGSSLDVVDASGQECALTDGDALQLKASPPADATSAELVVLASKGGQECAKSSVVSVSLNDLQEMQNHMRETVDRGLQELQSKAGKNGMPALPSSAQSQPAPAQYAAVAPPPDPNPAAQIQQQDLEAGKAEADVIGGASDQNTGVAASNQSIDPPTAPQIEISVGQSQAQIERILGAPLKVQHVQPNGILYVYKDFKIMFKGGKVTDVD